MNYKVGFYRLDNLFTFFTFAILFLLPILPTMAQKETEAKKILDQTSQAFKISGGVEADFTLIPYQRGEALEKITGNIQLKEECFCLKTDAMITWFNGKTQWTYLPANEEVNVSNPTREELESINPMAFLTLYKEGYSYQLGQRSMFNGEAVYEVTLSAENFDKQWANLTLYIDRTTLLPIYIKLKEAGKDYHVITITNYKQGMNWKIEHFTFNPKEYPDVEVIDLR